MSYAHDSALPRRESLSLLPQKPITDLLLVFSDGAMIAKAGVFILVVACLCPVYLMAQDNYEIQVYGADTVEPLSLIHI